MLKRMRGWAVFGFVGVLAAAGWSHAQEAAQSAPTWADFARLQQAVMAMDQRLQAVEDAVGQQPLPAAASTAGNEAMDQRLKAVESKVRALTVSNNRSKTTYSNKKAVKAVYIALYNNNETQKDKYMEMYQDANRTTAMQLEPRIQALKAFGQMLEQRMDKNGWW